MSEDEYIYEIGDHVKELTLRLKEQSDSLTWHRELLARHLVQFDSLNYRIKSLEDKLKECCGTRSWQG